MGFAEVISPWKQVVCYNKSYNWWPQSTLLTQGGVVVWLWGKHPEIRHPAVQNKLPNGSLNPRKNGSFLLKHVVSLFFLRQCILIPVKLLSRPQHVQLDVFRLWYKTLPVMTDFFDNKLFFQLAKWQKKEAQTCVNFSGGLMFCRIRTLQQKVLSIWNDCVLPLTFRKFSWGTITVVGSTEWQPNIFPGKRPWKTFKQVKMKGLICWFFEASLNHCSFSSNSIWNTTFKSHSKSI